MSRRTPSNRPAIWAEGRQHPPFDLRAFLRVTVILARADLARGLTLGARRAEGAGRAILSGRWRIPPQRLGRTGRFLPSHQRVGRGISGIAALLDRAGRSLDAVPVVEDSPPAAIRTVRRPRRPARVSQDAAPRPAEEPRASVTDRLPDAAQGDLAAIRALILAQTETAPERPAPSVALPKPASPGPAETLQTAATPAPSRLLAAIREHTAQGFARGLALGLLVCALPWGAARAGLAHLSGQDLRDLAAGD